MIENNKIYDCITFFDENLLTNSRFEILNEVVDFFIVCESKFDHSGKEKNLNFRLLNKKFQKKVRYLTMKENFPNLRKPWEIEKYQREIIYKGIYDAKDEDLIMYSDSDEIPNPDKLKNFKLNKKYGIFLQKFYVYKLNIYNEHETPWEGTRITKKKNLKSISHLRRNIKSKNLKKSFWKFKNEKSVELIYNGGWHFNNLYNAETISRKLKVFPHREFNLREYYDLNVVKKKINNLEDLFGRNHQYKKVKVDNSYPKFIVENLRMFKSYIL